MTRKWHLVPLSVIAVMLVAAGGFGATRAVLSIRSNPYLTRIETESLSTKLLEASEGHGPERRSGEGDLLKDLGEMNEAGEFAIGRSYMREFSVENDGDLPEYVRVSIYRYWTDETGRRIDLSPSLIDLGLVEDNGWHVDEEASTTSERTVMWYESPLHAGESSAPFTSSIAIDTEILPQFARYGNTRFHVEVVVDAIQTHNAKDAMRGAWGHSYDVEEEG